MYDGVTVVCIADSPLIDLGMWLDTSTTNVFVRTGTRVIQILVQLPEEDEPLRVPGFDLYLELTKSIGALL